VRLHSSPSGARHLRNQFGWSLPPGITSLPEEEEHACAICGRDAASCICPECPVCGTQGDPYCYQHHGISLTDEQVVALAEKAVEAAKAALDAAENYLSVMRDEGVTGQDRSMAQSALLANRYGG
jgi:hypothetical protein